MDDPCFVCEVKRLAQFAHDVDGFLDVEALAGVEEVLEFLALNELHHDVRDFALGAEVVHLHDIRVVQPRDRLGLAIETHRVLARRILVERALENGLDCNLAMQSRIHTSIDNTHGTLAQYGLDVVAPKCLYVSGWCRHEQSSLGPRGANADASGNIMP